MSHKLILYFTAPVTLCCHSYVSTTQWALSDGPLWQLIYPAPSLYYMDRSHDSTPTPLHQHMAECSVTVQPTAGQHHVDWHSVQKQKVPNGARETSGQWIVKKIQEPARLTFVCSQGANYFLTVAVFQRQFFLIINWRFRTCSLSTVNSNRSVDKVSDTARLHFLSTPPWET